jgi:hypothetical protein
MPQEIDPLGMTKKGGYPSASPQYDRKKGQKKLAILGKGLNVDYFLRMNLLFKNVENCCYRWSGWRYWKLYN